MKKEKKENIGVIISFIFIVILVGVVIYFLLNKQEKEDPTGWINTEHSFEETADQGQALDDNGYYGPEEEMGYINEGVEDVFDVSQNNMERVTREGDVLSMNYIGRLEDGTVFDSNVLEEFNHVEPFIFTLGAGQVIAGWDEGLAGMKIGERKTLVIPPEKGYGAREVGNIPANSTLIFEVELLDIIK